MLDAMTTETTETTEALTLQFLAFVADGERTYGETMEAWRSTCPRMSIWEDAVRDGLVRIEILENTQQSAPIAFDHVHFWLGDAATLPQIQAWYAKTFGAKAAKRGQFDADFLPGVTLLFAKSDAATVPTKGRAVDHIGFEIKNLEAFCKKAEVEGVKFDMPFTKRPDLGISLAFITDPWGTYIELNEGLDRL